MSNKPELKFKILIIGNSAVGKTSMLLKYTENRFPEAHIATIGVEFKVKIIETDKYKVQLNIWDTAGQERFKSLTKSFYNHTNGIIYVYDITDYETFEGVKSWMNEAEPYGIHESILCGNKLDLAEKGDRKVTVEEAEEKCKEFDIIWGGECSAKDFTVEDLKQQFEKYTREIFNKIGYNIVRSKTVKNVGDKKEKSKCGC